MVSLNDNDKSANDFHPLVVRIMYFGVLFYIYNLIFNDMMDYIREKDVSNIWDMEQIVSLLDAHTIDYKRSSNTILQQIDKNGDVLKEDSAKEMAEAAD